MSAHVQKYSLNPEGYTEFFIKISYIGKEWGLKKRWRDVVHFDSCLHKSGLYVNFALPEKTWWNRFDNTLLSQRQTAIQGYLDELFHNVLISENSLVREFLDIESNELSIKNITYEELDFKDRMKSIVNDTNNKMLTIIRKNAYDKPGTDSTCTSSNNSRKLSFVESNSRKLSFAENCTNSRKVSTAIDIINRNNSITEHYRSKTSFGNNEDGSNGPVRIGGEKNSYKNSKLENRRDNNDTVISQRDKRISLEFLSGSSAHVNALALMETIEENNKKQEFISHVNEILPIHRKSTVKLLREIEYNQLPIPYNNHTLVKDKNIETMRILSKPLSNLRNDLEYIIDECADSLLEASPSQSYIFISENDVIFKFKEPKGLATRKALIRSEASITSGTSSDSGGGSFVGNNNTNHKQQQQIDTSLEKTSPSPSNSPTKNKELQSNQTLGLPLSRTTSLTKQPRLATILEQSPRKSDDFSTSKSTDDITIEISDELEIISNQNKSLEKQEFDQIKFNSSTMKSPPVTQVIEENIAPITPTNRPKLKRGSRI
jgi:hypothetical protein